MLSPAALQEMRRNPQQYGYKELDNRITALWLVIKLRIFAPWYMGQMQTEAQPLISRSLSNNHYGFYHQKVVNEREVVSSCPNQTIH